MAATTLVAALVATGCSDGTSVQDSARVRVLLTDAPADYIASAMVDIGAIDLVPADGGDAVRLTDDGTDGLVDLLDLAGTATAALADADIPANDYAQMRLIVEAATVQLADGFEFTDGTSTRDLKVPSGAQTGIKLNLTSADGDSGPVTLSGGETVALVVDFDVSRSFVLQGSPLTPAGIHGALLKPTLRVAIQDAAGTISGTVSTDLEGVSVAGLTVTAEPVDDGLLEDYQTRTATAMTADDGTYTINFVVPGTYDVSVEAPDGYAMDPASVDDVAVAESAEVTDVDFAVVAGGG